MQLGSDKGLYPVFWTKHCSHAVACGWLQAQTCTHTGILEISRFCTRETAPLLDLGVVSLSGCQCSGRKRDVAFLVIRVHMRNHGFNPIHVGGRISGHLHR